METSACGLRYTRNFLTFANTTAIAYRKNLEAPGNFSPICNSSCVCKRQKITSIVKLFFHLMIQDSQLYSTVVCQPRGMAGIHESVCHEYGM